MRVFKSSSLNSKGNFPAKLNGFFRVWLLVSASACMLISTKPASAQNVCPPVGYAPTCDVLFTLNDDQSITPQLQNTTPYDGNDDNLVGIQNNSSNLVLSSLRLTGPDIFGFDGDGISKFSFPTYGPTGYEGPNTSFTKEDNNNGVVNFINPLSPGQSTYFSLESAPSADIKAVPQNISVQNNPSSNLGSSGAGSGGSIGGSSTGNSGTPQPVPEPLTCAGAAVAGGIGGLMKRQQAKAQKVKA